MEEATKSPPKSAAAIKLDDDDLDESSEDNSHMMPVHVRFAILSAINHLGGKDVSGPQIRQAVYTLTNHELVLSNGGFTSAVRRLKDEKMISTRKDPKPEKIQGGQRHLHTMLSAGYEWMNLAFRIIEGLIRHPIPAELVKKTKEQAATALLHEAAAEQTMRPTVGAMALLHTLCMITGRSAEDCLLERVIIESKLKR